MYKYENLSEKLQHKNIFAQDLTGKNIIIRTCLNVVLDKQGNIVDATRIEESAPTLKSLGEKAKRVIMLAHLGRPTLARESEFSLEPVRVELEKRLNCKIILLKNEQELTEELSAQLSKGSEQKFYLVENIRYFKGEESKDKNERLEFAKFLAQFGDYYVNDAFADYREASSTYDLAELLPAFLGPVFIREIEAVNYFNEAKSPFVAILGGAKLSEKLDTMKALAKVADKILIGGAMAYTLLKAQGHEIGKSLYEPEKLEVATAMLKDFGDKLVLPSDHLVAAAFSKDSATTNTSDVEIPAESYAVDIGEKTQAEYARIIAGAETILWNGPMGVFEWESCEAGTKTIGTAIIENSDAYKFAGGGDSISAINKFKLTGFNHVSTGGGAMLSFIANEDFPTLDIILNKD